MHGTSQRPWSPPSRGRRIDLTTPISCPPARIRLPVMPDPDYPRDLIGYGRDAPHARWPDGARIAVQFVLNYEEGGENSVLHGDRASEQFLSEIVGARGLRGPAPVDGVDLRIRLARRRLADPARVRSRRLAAHGVRRRHGARAPSGARRSIRRARPRDRQPRLALDPLPVVAEAVEREHLVESTRVVRELTDGRWPLGWYTGRDSPNTRRLVVEHGGYEYDSDYYGDDLPFWTDVDDERRRRARRTWSCRTRSTPTTCASRRRRASTPATISSPTCATASTRSTPKAIRTASTARR